MDSGPAFHTDAGFAITPADILRSTAHCNAVELLSGIIAYLPLFIYERGTDDPSEKKVAYDHPLYTLLHEKPNPHQSAYDFKGMMTANALLYGNAVAVLEREGEMIVGIYGWPMTHVTLERDGFDILYKLRAKGNQTVTKTSRDIFHLRLFSLDGLTGLCKAELHSNSIALSLAAEEYAARFFRQGATAPYAIQVEGILSDERHEELRRRWSKNYSGSSNWHIPGVLEERADIKPLGMFAPQESQMTECRKHQNTEAARSFNVPPTKVGDWERATFANVEQASIDFVTYSLGNILGMWQSACFCQLLSPEEQRRRMLVEFKVDALLKGDIRTRYRAYAEAWDRGFLSANEVRAMENRPRRKDPDGDAFFHPLNMESTNQKTKEEDKDDA